MPEPMASGGVYDHHSDYQMRGAMSQAELVESIAAGLAPAGDRGGLVIADYGCAQGRVTNMLIRRAVEKIRERHPDTPLSVFHNDLLSNDWATFLGHLRAAHQAAEEGVDEVGDLGGRPFLLLRRRLGPRAGGQEEDGDEQAHRGQRGSPQKRPGTRSTRRTTSTKARS